MCVVWGESVSCTPGKTDRIPSCSISGRLEIRPVVRSLVEPLPDFRRMDGRNKLSFRQTFRHRGRAIDIRVAPCDPGEDGRLLNYLASSIVAIDNAVCAFCAALNPNILMEIPYG